MANLGTPPVPYKTPLTDNNGILTVPWSSWFRQLFAQVGGNNGVPLINPMSNLGDTLYQGVASTASLSGTTSAIKHALTQTGTGAASSAPVWVATGTMTESTSSVLTLSNWANTTLGSPTIQVKQSSASQSGYLSSADWSTFNSKQTSGSYITALTGDGTASGPGSTALTLATVNTNIGTFASATVNGKGLITAAANLSGDATTSGSALTLATVNTNTGSFGSSTAIPSFTVNGKGLLTAASTSAVVAPAGTVTGTVLASNVVTSSLTTVGTIATGTWSGTTIAIGKGGTGQTTAAAAFNALSPMTTGGDLIYGGASGAATRLANGSAGQILASQGTTLAPQWITSSAGFAPNFQTSTAVSTNSSNISSATFATFSNSPALAFTPTATGTYKVYCGATIQVNTAATGAEFQIVKTSGTGILLAASTATVYCQNDSIFFGSVFIQSTYTLTSGTAYVFDIQGQISTGAGNTSLNGSNTPFYMFAERVT